jgi:hypothetical protein
MWRGKSEGDERSAGGRDERGRAGSGPGQRPPGRSRQTDRRAAPDDDPRSEPTGKKIRRIESGPPSTSAADRTRVRRAGSSPSLAARVAGPGSGDPTDLGGPPTEAPGRSFWRPPSNTEQVSGFGLGAGLPPLNQPSGEVPVVPADPNASTQAEAGGGAGVFDDRPERSIARSVPSTLASGGAARAAMSAVGDTGPGARGRFAAAPSGAAEDETSIDLAGPDESDLSPALRAARVSGHVATAPPSFPDRHPTGAQSQTDPFPGWSEAAVDATVSGDQTAAMAVSARERLAGASAAAAASATRLQDTELKLAGQRRKPKPKEPNRLVLGLAMALVVLAGAAVAWWLTRADGTNDQAADGLTTDTTAATDDLTAADEAATGTDAMAEGEPVVDEPTLLFEEAQLGPLDRDSTYGIDLAGEPEGALLQVVVDDIPQGQPDTVLPDLILPAGRHTIHIAITNGAEVTNSTPVEVYVLGDPPPAGYLANLASVDIQNEGWAEAIRRFDEFRAAGHESLQMLPLTAGYWNIYVGELGSDATAVDTYCESFQLSVPDQCFPKLFDPADYTPPAPTGAGTAAGTTDTTTGEADSMTDQSGEATSTTTSGG